jgi:hypothetical protein
MKLSRRQTRVILAFRRALLGAWWLKMKWKDYISFYYYYKCYRYEYGGEGISRVCFENWKNHIPIKISERNPYKSRYKELFGAPSF